MRKNRDSKYYVLKQVGDDWVLFTKTDDLTDMELKRHLRSAINSEDFEYANEVKAEIESRQIKVAK